LARTYVDPNGTHIQFSSDELKSILTTTDMGELLYEIVGLDAFTNKQITPEILNVFMEYIRLNKNALANAKANGILLTLPPGGNGLSVVAKPL
jgi:hypothetical protein